MRRSSLAHVRNPVLALPAAARLAALQPAAREILREVLLELRLDAAFRADWVEAARVDKSERLPATLTIDRRRATATIRRHWAHKAYTMPLAHVIEAAMARFMRERAEQALAIQGAVQEGPK